MAKILVVDDEDSVRLFLVRALEVHGHDVTAAGDGSAALAVLEQQGFDLLVTDIMMPVVDGIALALRAAKDAPDMPILMMTGYAAQGERAHNLDDLVFDVLMKPFEIADFVERIDAALASAEGQEA